jgi:DNA-binding FadR family transcriptional regulator
MSAHPHGRTERRSISEQGAVPLVGLAAQRATDEDVARLRDLLAEAESRPDDGKLVGEVDERLHRIVRAIGRGDPAAAERAMREHLVYVRDLVAAIGSAERARDD